MRGHVVFRSRAGIAKELLQFPEKFLPSSNCIAQITAGQPGMPDGRGGRGGPRSYRVCRRFRTRATCINSARPARHYAHRVKRLSRDETYANSRALFASWNFRRRPVVMSRHFPDIRGLLIRDNPRCRVYHVLRRD